MDGRYVLGTAWGGIRWACVREWAVVRETWARGGAGNGVGVIKGRGLGTGGVGRGAAVVTRASDVLASGSEMISS